MTTLKIAFSYLAYPFTIANYFRRSLERRQDVELFTLGAFTGQLIPWNGGMTIPSKYLNSLDLPLPDNMLHPSWEQIEGMLPWKPDLSITVDAGWYYSTKPTVLSAHVATDPHVLDYTQGRKNSDFFFNMQPSYMRDGDILLPYAFDPACHYPEAIEKEYDVAMIGLRYTNRDSLVSAFTANGITYKYGTGEIYDEYRETYNKARYGVVQSSLEDVIARVFEVMAMRLVPILNRLPGLDALGFEEGRHYLGFSNVPEAISKIQWAKENPEMAGQIANGAYQFVHEHNMTYDGRIQQILEKVGLV